MIIRRLTIKYFKAIKEIDLSFDDSGVYIIVGPNEIGKTSLFDALLLLLEMKDSAKGKSVSKCKSLFYDEPIYVCAELKVNNFEFRYEKQWLTNKKTNLEIHSPELLKLTGEQAHDKVSEILREFVDFELFKSLKYLQGSQTAVPTLKSSPSLVYALEQTSTVSTGEISEGASLIQRVSALYHEFYGKDGRTKSILKDMKSEMEEVQEKLNAATKKKKEIDQANINYYKAKERQALLHEDLKRNEANLSELKIALKALEVEAEKIRKLESKAELNNVKLSKVVDDLGRIETLKNTIERLVASRVQLEDDVYSSRNSVLQTRYAELLDAKEEHEKSLHDLKESIEHLVEVENYLVQKFLLTTMTERLELTEDFRREKSQVLTELENILITENDLAFFQDKFDLKSQLEVELEILNRQVRLHALDDLVLEFDGKKSEVLKGNGVELPSQFEIIGVAQISNVSDSGANQVKNNLSQIEDEIETRLKVLGVKTGSSFETLKLLYLNKVNLQSRLSEIGKNISMQLRDISEDELKVKLEHVRDAVLEFEATGTLLEGSPTDKGEAEALIKELKQDFVEKSFILDGIDRDIEGITGEIQNLEKAEIEKNVMRKSVEDQIEDFSKEYEVQAESLASLKDEKVRLEEILSELKLELVDSDSLETLTVLQEDITNLELKVERLDRDYLQSSGDVREIAGELKSASNTEIDFEISQLNQQLNVSTDKLRFATKRHDAVRLLYELIINANRKTSERYAEPFAASLNSLALRVFGKNTVLEVDPLQLQVVYKVDDGIRVEFDDLSVGAKEQIGILTRIAASNLVGRLAKASKEDKGKAVEPIPLILDDALTNTDPNRLLRTGGIISALGKETQVMLVTCDPARDYGIGDAMVIDIGRRLLFEK